MKPVIDFLKRQSNLPLPRLALMAAVAGGCTIVVLSTLNSGAVNASKGDALGWLFVLFAAAAAAQIYSQRYLHITTQRSCSRTYSNCLSCKSIGSSFYNTNFRNIK